MRAARIDQFGGPEVVAVEEIAVPEPGPGQVLVDVAGSAINPVDVAIRSGWMQDYVPLSLPVTLGGDVSGVVEVVGGDVLELQVGQRVYGSAAAIFGNSGAFAEQAVSNAGLLAAVPASIDVAVAGTLPLAGVGALQAVTEVLDVHEGETLLIVGAAGGVGGFATMIAKSLGATVIAVARGVGLEAARSLGADQVVDSSTDGWREGLPPVDTVLELAGSANPGAAVTSVKDGGRVACLVGPVDAQAAAARGVTAERVAVGVNSERLARLAQLVDAGVVRPRVHATFSLGDIAAAFDAQAAGGVLGKLAIRLP